MLMFADDNCCLDLDDNLKILIQKTNAEVNNCTMVKGQQNFSKH